MTVLSLTSRSRILDTMGEEMDSTSGRLKLAQRKVQEILRKTSGRAQCYIMIALIVLLCILMILAFS